MKRLKKEDEQREITHLIQHMTIDLSAHLARTDKAISGMKAAFARDSFLSQSENRRKLLLTRFWKQPVNLVERCLQAIASEIIKNGFVYDQQKLPVELNRLIDERLDDFSRGIIQEWPVAAIMDSLGEPVFKDTSTPTCKR